MECVPPLSSILFRDRQTTRSYYCQAQPSNEAQLNLCKVTPNSAIGQNISDKGKFTKILRSVNKFSKINTTSLTLKDLS